MFNLFDYNLAIRVSEHKLLEPCLWSLATFEFQFWIQILSPFFSNSWRFGPASGCVKYSEYFFWSFFFYRYMNVIACIVRRLQEMLKISLYGTVNIPVISSSHIELNTVVFNNCFLLNCVCFDKRAVNAILLVLCFLSNIL